jgi:hypothetical protein
MKTRRKKRGYRFVIGFLDFTRIRSQHMRGQQRGFTNLYDWPPGEIMGFANSADYLRQALAAVIAANEEDTILSDDGRILCRQYSYNENAEP